MSTYKGHKNSNDSKRASNLGATFLRVIAGILGVLMGAYLYISIVFGSSFVGIPIVSKTEYETIELNPDSSTTGGDISSSWAQGGHTRLFYDPNHPIIEVSPIDANVENVLVFGVDSRGTDDYKCRTDAMMVVSINKALNTVKIVSLMRDTGVYIGDTNESALPNLDKLNAAYTYGGVGLMINTINRSFGLDIQRFIMLDFASAKDVINLCDGVDIDVSAAEVKYANQFIQEDNQLTGSNSPLLTHCGLQTLDGVQAVSWSRIRYLDSDFVRTSRQREIAMALIRKVAKYNYFEKLSFLKNSAGMFETNMQTKDIMRIGLNGASGVNSISEYRLPADNLYTVQNDPWMMILDFNSQNNELHQYLWGT